MLQLKIVTPEGIVTEEMVYQVTLPIEGGEVTVLAKHMPYIGALKPGELLLRMDPNGDERSLFVSGGFAEFHENTLVILADTAERVEEIDREHAETARRNAEILNQSAMQLDAEEYARTAIILEREWARVKVVRKHHSKKQFLYSSDE
ncbi:MAG: ATP synthase F1 subunit epsilon [Minisyncoccota bacterium]